nr:hypothetical protein [Salinibacter ruber]
MGEPCGQLLDEVFAAELNTLVDFRYPLSLPLPVVGQAAKSFLLFPGELLLFAAKPLLFAFEPAWIPGFLAPREHRETFDPQVYPDGFKVAVLSIGSRELADFLGANKADVVPSCGIFHRPHQLLGSEGSSFDHRTLMSPGIFERRSFRLPPERLLSSPRQPEGCADVPSGLAALLRLEGRVLGPTLKEVGERLLQIEKALLERHRTDLRQPLGPFLLLLGGETTGEIGK